jgi:hypothetical protein
MARREKKLMVRRQYRPWARRKQVRTGHSEGQVGPIPVAEGDIIICHMGTTYEFPVVCLYRFFVDGGVRRGYTLFTMQRVIVVAVVLANVRHFMFVGFASQVSLREHFISIITKLIVSVCDNSILVIAQVCAF